MRHLAIHAHLPWRYQAMLQQVQPASPYLFVTTLSCSNPSEKHTIKEASHRTAHAARCTTSLLWESVGKQTPLSHHVLFMKASIMLIYEVHLMRYCIPRSWLTIHSGFDNKRTILWRLCTTPWDLKWLVKHVSESFVDYRKNGARFSCFTNSP